MILYSRLINHLNQKVKVCCGTYCRTDIIYDFYGELLNEHQRNVYEDAVFNDLSLSEIADEYNISRQGVHDLIKRVSNTLEGYESKLHLIEKFMDTKAKVTKIDELVDSYIASPDMKLILEIKDLSNEIIEDY